MTDLYKNMTEDDFFDHLEGIIREMSVREVLAIPGIYDVLKEYFNNDVLESWVESRLECDECEGHGDLCTNDDIPRSFICEKCEGRGFL